MDADPADTISPAQEEAFFDAVAGTVAGLVPVAISLGWSPNNFAMHVMAAIAATLTATKQVTPVEVREAIEGALLSSERAGQGRLQ